MNKSIHAQLSQRTFREVLAQGETGERARVAAAETNCIDTGSFEMECEAFAEIAG
jgi:hypothetical protein